MRATFVAEKDQIGIGEPLVGHGHIWEAAPGGYSSAAETMNENQTRAGGTAGPHRLAFGRDRSVEVFERRQRGWHCVVLHAVAFLAARPRRVEVNQGLKTA